jgi:hypothetical protein
MMATVAGVTPLVALKRIQAAFVVAVHATPGRSLVRVTL